MQIAIDGPSGAGKSTIAKELSEKLGFEYLDTGAMYRALALEFNNSNFSDFSNQDNLIEFLSKIKIDIVDGNLLLNGKDVSRDIRAEEIGMLASKISSFPIVRNFLVEKQREIAKGKDIIMDGRDVGTVILIDADSKIYLTATLEERASRRHAQLMEKGDYVDFNEVLSSIKKRDLDDTTREHSPLRKAEDAIEVDCTDLTIDETVNRILEIIGKIED